MYACDCYCYDIDLLSLSIDFNFEIDLVFFLKKFYFNFFNHESMMMMIDIYEIFVFLLLITNVAIENT